MFFYVTDYKQWLKGGKESQQLSSLYVSRILKRTMGTTYDYHVYPHVQLVFRF